MAWTLGGTTLPNPHEIGRKLLTKGVYHEMINGASKRDISNIKEQFVLRYKGLTQTDALEIVNLFTALESAGSDVYEFAASQGSLSIPARDVHLDIATREYNMPGGEFREDIAITLTDAT